MNERLNSKTLRDSFGRFATGVTVVTADAPPLGPFGMTVNSFASLSLDPPLLLWNLQKDSECYVAFDATEHYAVNVLSREQQMLSSRLASKGQHELNGADDWHRGKYNCPLLDGSLAHFECRIVNRHDGGDHVILVGQIESFDSRDGEPLIFYAGGYRSLDIPPSTR